MKKHFLLGLLLCLLGGGSLFSEALIPFEYPVRLMSKPVYYEGSFFAFISPSMFAKLDKKGHVVWKIAKPASEIKAIQAQFNHLFLLHNSGFLECYDSKLGYRVWVRTGVDIQAVKVSYPSIYFLNSDSYIGTLDFQTGHFTGLSQIVWMGPTVFADPLVDLKKLLGEPFEYKGNYELLESVKVDNQVFIFMKK